MNRRWTLNLTMWLAAVVAAIPPCEAAGAADSPDSLYWKQRVFSIPFQVNQADAETTSEVRLFVSVDGGRNWQFAQRAAPDARRFTFRAPRDGQYFFAIRSVDRRGNLQPPGALAAELRVFVDTQPPQLELDAQRGPDGEVRLSWRALDPNLRAESLKIGYRASEGGNWLPLDVAQQSADDQAGSIRSGHATWWPPGEVQQLAVRGEVFDRAGNRGTAEGQLSALPATSDPPASETATTNPAGDTHRTEQPQTDVAKREAQAGPYQRPIFDPPGGGAKPQHPGTAPPDSSPRSQPWPADERTGQPLSVGKNQAAVGEVPARTASLPRDATKPSLPPTGDLASQPESSAAIMSSADPRGEPSPEDADIPTLALNSSRFELSYDVVDVRSGGIGRVELWGLREGRFDWELLAVDEDRRSPVTAEVEGEGKYGFRVLVHSQSGLTGRTPQAGDAPQAWVIVDLTPPLVEIVEVSPAGQPGGGTMSIRYRASDPALAERPIALSYATQPGGPWLEIESELPNSGHYRWQPGEEVPDRVYLRIEARDTAGNLGHAETAEPVSLNRAVPRGQIRRVRPIGGPLNRLPAVNEKLAGGS